MKRMLQGSSRPRALVLWKCIPRRAEPKFVYHQGRDSFTSATHKPQKTLISFGKFRMESAKLRSAIQTLRLPGGARELRICIRGALEQLLQRRTNTISGLVRCVRHATRTFKLELRVAMIPALRVQTLHSIVCLVQRSSSEKVRTTFVHQQLCTAGALGLLQEGL
jgi:hypothetical protein